MGEVARVRDGNKRCPICRYSPIIYFQPEDANAEQVEIPYPFGFKGDIPLLTEVAYDEARAAEQLDPVTGRYFGFGGTRRKFDSLCVLNGFSNNHERS
eukprot:scaffold17977_cov33-Attheya_sp.AAC.2